MASTDSRPVPLKNVAFRVVFPILDADGDLVTGATGLDSEVSKDQGTFADCTNEATEIATSSGVYYLDLTSTEMNADSVAVIVKTTSSGAKTTVVALYPEETGDINVDVVAFGGTAGTFASGRPDVNTTHLAGTAQTGRDVGASVLLSTGTGTGQLDFTSGVVKANLAQILGTALTETAGLLAGGFKKFFNVATPTGTVNSLADAVPGAAGGGFIAGTNAATTVTTALTTTFTGNVTGSVASVTGNVGGNVTGSIGSLAAQAKADVNAEADTALADVGVTTTITGRIDAAVSTRAPEAAGNVAAIKTQTDKLVFTVANQVDSNVLDWKSATAPAMTGDAYARLGAPAGASTAADIAAIKVDTAAVKVKTDSLTFTVAGQADANVIDWKSATAPAMTGDAYARLGAPAGASTAADIAAVKAETATINGNVNDIETLAAATDSDVAAIKLKTDKLTFDADNHLASAVKKLVDTPLAGDGSATPWGP